MGEKSDGKEKFQISVKQFSRRALGMNGPGKAGQCLLKSNGKSNKCQSTESSVTFKTVSMRMVNGTSGLHLT